jgi:predicted MFS family arabinose efflux permease
MLECGLILEWFSWRASFVATAVLAAVAFAAAKALAPNTSDPDDAVIDSWGFVLSGLGVGALIYAIIDGAEAGWTTRNALIALTIAAASLAAFVRRELTTARPMLDVRLFRLRGFSTGTLALTVQFLCLFGFFLVGMQFLQLILGYSPLRSALSLLPLGMIVMPMSRVAPHLVERLGQRTVMATGLGFLAVGLTIMSRLDGQSTYWHFLGGLVVVGFGIALTSTPSTTAIVASLPQAKQGVGSAVNDLSREFGSALGIAILGSLFSTGYAAAVGDSTASLPHEAAHAVQESPGAAFAVAARLGDGGRGLTSAVRNAFADGINDALTAGAVIAVLAAGFVIWRAPRAAHT